MQTIETTEAQDSPSRRHARTRPAGLPGKYDPWQSGWKPTLAEAEYLLQAIADHRARAARIRENAEKLAHAEDQEATWLMGRFGMDLAEIAQRELTDIIRLSGENRQSVRLFDTVIDFANGSFSIR